MPFPVVGAVIAGSSAVLARYLVPYIIIQAIVAIGLTVVTFTGVDLLTDFFVDEVRNASGSLPADLVAILAMAGIFDWMEVVLAAWVAAINIKQLRGAFKRIALK